MKTDVYKRQQQQRPPRVTGDDGRWAVAMVLAGTRSFLEERPIYLQEVMDYE